ncbi:MAG: response regulator [Bacillota bacterium]
MKENNICKVLLVEDNPGDILLLKETMLEENGPICLEVITNGEDALEYLYSKASSDDFLGPDLIILDLNLPKRSGKEILEEISTDKILSKIPVVILTSADIDDDVFTNGRYNIKYYMIKPIDLDDYLDVINFIKNYAVSLLAKSLTSEVNVNSEI